MRTREQRRRLQDVAVDQRQRAGVLHAADGVKQQRAVDAVDRNADVAGTEPAHRELGAEVVAGADAGQHMHGAKRIVRNEPAQRQDLAAAEHRLARHAGFRFAKAAAAHRDFLDIRARAFIDGNRHIDGLGRADRHFTAHQSELDDRDEEGLRADGHIEDFEPAVRIGKGLLPGGLDLNEDSRQRRARARFDDRSCDLARVDRQQDCQKEDG